MAVGYICFTRRRRAQRARVVATPRSEGPSTYTYHPLPPQNRAGRVPGRRLNTITYWAVAVAMHAVVAIQSPTTSPRPNTNRPAAAGNWRLAGEWLRARNPASKHQKQEPRRRSGQAAPPDACRVSTAHCACALAPAPDRGLLWFVGSRSTCAAAAALRLRLAAHCALRTPRCRSQRQRAR